MTARIIDQTGDDISSDEDIRTDYDKTIDYIKSAFNAGDDEERWHVTVHMVNGTNRRGGTEPYLFTCSVEELPIQDRLLSQYGTGIFRCRVFRNGTGFKTFTVETLAAIKTPTHAPESPSLVQAIEAANQRTMQLVEQLTARPAPVAQPIDPIEMMAKMLGMMTSLKTLLPEPAAGGMDMFTKGMELAASMAEKMNGGAGETGVLDLVKEVIRSPQVGEVLAGLVHRGAAPPGQLAAPSFQQQPMQPGARLAAPPPIPVAPPNPSGMTQEQSLTLINQQIAYLISRAQRGSDPELYAEFVLDNVPKGMIPQLLANPNVLTELQAVNPAMVHYLPWFTRLLEAIREMAQGDGDEAGTDDAAGGAAHDHDDNTGGAGRNAGNAPAHGKAGKAV